MLFISLNYLVCFIISCCVYVWNISEILCYFQEGIVLLCDSFSKAIGPLSCNTKYLILSVKHILLDQPLLSWNTPQITITRLVVYLASNSMGWRLDLILTELLWSQTSTYICWKLYCAGDLTCSWPSVTWVPRKAVKCDLNSSYISPADWAVKQGVANDLYKKKGPKASSEWVETYLSYYHSCKFCLMYSLRFLMTS